MNVHRAYGCRKAICTLFLIEKKENVAFLQRATSFVSCRELIYFVRGMCVLVTFI